MSLRAGLNLLEWLLILDSHTYFTQIHTATKHVHVHVVCLRTFVSETWSCNVELLQQLWI